MPTILGRPQAVALFALFAGTMFLLLGTVVLISRPFSPDGILVLPETGAPVCDPKNLTMSVSPVPGVKDQNMTFSLVGSSEGDTWIQDTWSGGVSCTGNVWPSKSCKATANGTFTWTHKWKKCQGNTNNCSTLCSKSLEYKVGTTAASPTPAVSCVSQLKATCSADNTQATFTWNGASAASGYILRVDHDPSNAAQCLNTVTNANVGWYCPASSQCKSASCDDHYQQFSSTASTLSKTLSVKTGENYKWSVEAIRDAGNCRVDVSSTLNCATAGATVCGPMDTDANGNLDLIDFSKFAQVYRKTCSSRTGQGTTCGSQDADPASGVVDLYDFNVFASHYRKSDCD